MSQVFCLGKAGGSQWTLMMLIPVPDELNSAGVSLRQALSDSGLNISVLEGPHGEEIIPTPGRLTDLQGHQVEAGELYVYAEDFPMAATTPAAFQSEMQDKYAEDAAAALDDLRGRLKWYGLAV